MLDIELLCSNMVVSVAAVIVLPWINESVDFSIWLGETRTDWNYVIDVALGSSEVTNRELLESRICWFSDTVDGDTWSEDIKVDFNSVAKVAMDSSKSGMSD